METKRIYVNKMDFEICPLPDPSNGRSPLTANWFRVFKIEPYTGERIQLKDVHGYENAVDYCYLCEAVPFAMGRLC